MCIGTLGGNVMIEGTSNHTASLTLRKVCSHGGHLGRARIVIFVVRPTCFDQDSTRPFTA